MIHSEPGLICIAHSSDVIGKVNESHTIWPQYDPRDYTRRISNSNGSGHMTNADALISRNSSLSSYIRRTFDSVRGA